MGSCSCTKMSDRVQELGIDPSGYRGVLPLHVYHSASFDDLAALAFSGDRHRQSRAAVFGKPSGDTNNTAPACAVQGQLAPVAGVGLAVRHSPGQHLRQGLPSAPPSSWPRLGCAFACRAAALRRWGCGCPPSRCGHCSLFQATSAAGYCIAQSADHHGGLIMTGGGWTQQGQESRRGPVGRR